MKQRVKLRLSFFALMLLIIAGNNSIRAQEGGWREPARMLLSSDKEMAPTLRQLKIDRGEWLVLLGSVDCGRCEMAARKLDELKDQGHKLAIIYSSPEKTAAWRRRLQIKYAVVAAWALPEDQLGFNRQLNLTLISLPMWESFGPFYMPTVVKFRDGHAIGVREMP